MVGVPTFKTDNLRFNLQRVYGPVQLSHLFANWELVYSSYNPNITEQYWHTRTHVVKKLPQTSTKVHQSLGPVDKNA